ncbi:tryptophan synthase beta subunit-like PLP-dependent enzyme [Suillus brevipes Sb2]|nr:tryptophan synthase beta subunit-like PLP-dependent enzyme [Suillus brevipes Sb2]
MWPLAEFTDSMREESVTSKSAVNGVVGSMGHTPLLTRSRIHGKAELQNTGGSVKTDAEKKGRMKPGGAVVEGTAGNTGIGLAHVSICRARAYTQSQDDLLRMLGAEVYPVLAGPSPRESVELQRLENTKGEIDGFVCATGTGGTLAGASICREEATAGFLYEHITFGGNVFERFGSSRILVLDTEGLYVGACSESALNVVAAVELAQKLGKDKDSGSKVATILCDGAYRYQCHLFSKKWLESKGLGNATPGRLRKYAVLD